jgi:polyhydroxyalkanoate synthase
MTTALPGTDTVRGLGRELSRTRLRAQNGIKLIAGTDPPRVGVTPKDEVWSRGKVRLYRYRSDRVCHGPPLLLFIGLMSGPYFLDLHPGNSFVERLLDAGFDVFLLDWGAPDAAEGDHGLETYVDYYLPRAIDAVLRAAGAQDLTIVGYCMGAFLALLALGSRDDLPVRNLVVLTPLVDLHQSSGAAAHLRNGVLEPESFIDETTNLVPATLVEAFFRLRKPTADAVQYVNLWEHLWRKGYAQGHQAMAQWVWDHVALPGPVFLQLAHDYIRDNALMTGRARVGGRPVRLRSITVPALIMTAERDELVPPACSAPLVDMLGSPDVEAHAVPAGHIGLIMGRTGAGMSSALIVDWLKRHSTPKEAPCPSTSAG